MTIKEIRALTGLSQLKFSWKYWIPETNIKKWECGANNPPKYVFDLLEFRVRNATGNEVKEDFTMTINEIRNLTGLTQQKFADAYGIPKVNIAKWESGMANPPKYINSLLAFKVKHDYNLLEQK